MAPERYTPFGYTSAMSETTRGVLYPARATIRSLVRMRRRPMNPRERMNRCEYVFVVIAKIAPSGSIRILITRCSDIHFRATTA